MNQGIVLKECPCCGPTERTDLKPVIRWDANHKWSFVQCPICGVRTGQSPEDWASAHQWNTRFYGDEITRLRAALTRIAEDARPSFADWAQTIAREALKGDQP